jgi:hypothetical protein
MQQQVFAMQVRFGLGAVRLRGCVGDLLMISLVS